MDIGCGCGFSSRQAARLAASATVLGVDLSGPMIDHARRRSIDEGLTNTEFLQADAQVYPFAPRSFDVAISRFGAMFFGDPVAAFTNVAAALRPGGRLALLAWQDLGPRVGIALAGPARVGSASGAVARWQWSLTAERGRACR
jgi:ubiquinone/menaquinone biosynthesis C-methylase UbiE